MADSDFEAGFEEIYGEVKENLSGRGATGNTNAASTTDATGTTRTTDTTSHLGSAGRTQHPFSVRLDPKYTERIKALAWWWRTSQRNLIEQAIDQLLEQKITGEQLQEILHSYRNHNNV